MKGSTPSIPFEAYRTLGLPVDASEQDIKASTTNSPSGTIRGGGGDTATMKMWSTCRTMMFSHNLAGRKPDDDFYDGRTRWPVAPWMAWARMAAVAYRQGSRTHKWIPSASWKPHRGSRQNS